MNEQPETTRPIKSSHSPWGIAIATLIGLMASAWLVRPEPNAIRDGAIRPNVDRSVSVRDNLADNTQRQFSTEMNDRHTRMREVMVEHHLRGRDITDARVLQVMQRIPRHQFVPAELEREAYADRPLPIGEGQTISQPYIVALMTQLAQVSPESRVLDIGTGSGYQAAVLSELCKQVYSIEIIESLAEEARQRLARLGYDNIEVRAGDGYFGWPEESPFDAIIAAAAPAEIPQPLIDQLAPGGRMVIPVGKQNQDLVVVEKDAQGMTRQWRETPVAFVPMTGKARSTKSED